MNARLLSGSPAALDRQGMAVALAPLLGGTAVPRVSSARLVAAKAERRAVVRYRVAAAGGSEVLYGKLYADAARAREVWSVSRRLWSDVFGSRGSLGVPEPLALLDDPVMVVYRRAPGCSLDALAWSDDGAHLFALTGRWLGQLHASGLRLERRFDLATECANLEVWAAALLPHGELAAEAATLARRLRERAGALALDAGVPLHKDFHYQHVLVGDGVQVIDFDEMRMGDAGFDVAHFCANLDLLALRSNGAAERIAGLRRAFLGAYGRATGWRPDERFDWFHGYTCVKVAKQLATRRGPRPWPEGHELRRQARAMLALGRTTGGAR